MYKYQLNSASIGYANKLKSQTLTPTYPHPYSYPYPCAGGEHRGGRVPAARDAVWPCAAAPREHTAVCERRGS